MNVTDTRSFVGASYVLLGAVLLLSHLASLGHSFWQDEIIFVDGFLQGGLDHILAGPDLSHELYAVLAWSSWEIFPGSETVLRLWSAVPFVAGVVIVTAWLHARLAPLAGLLYLFLATISPMLLDITRQARGYGLAYFAMSVLVVGALEANRTGRTIPLAAMLAAGVVGTWTLPQFGIGFVAVTAVVAANPELRRRATTGLIAAVAAIVAWYAPHLDQVRESAQVPSGSRIDTAWLLTAPFDHILVPALLWIEGVYVVPDLIWLPVVLLAVLVIASSPFLRDRTSALVLCAGPITTIVVLWITQAYVIPRYLSYLLVPIFVLLASGAASILARTATRPAILRTLVCLVAIGGLALNFVSVAPDVVRLPREANRDAAEVIERRGSPTTPVLVYLHVAQDKRPNIEFYLDRRVRVLARSEVVDHVCNAPEPLLYVTQPFRLPGVAVPCLSRPGTEHHRLRQYTRGGEISVWFVPPEA